MRIIETGSGWAAPHRILILAFQPLSRNRMSRLENELVIRLLQRTSRGVTPTNAGWSLFLTGANSRPASCRRRVILAAREARLPVM
ncbi:hypothetical protein KCP76_17620 [Salmonella enterica subsp. enterica serovar Weltevreden]|nr:hypothetical protein KCP76_17620 [Salmonella enterica subsp. enterica serovar Weltevreden]